MSVQAHQVRSVYRRFLRELPQRTPSILANPSPIQQRIRDDLSQNDKPSSSSMADTKAAQPSHRIAEAEQFLHYLKAQRLYTTLLERYNPGMNMNDEERIRLTARRVGMNLPVEVEKNGHGD